MLDFRDEVRSIQHSSIGITYHVRTCLGAQSYEVKPFSLFLQAHYVLLADGTISTSNREQVRLSDYLSNISFSFEDFDAGFAPKA